MKTEAETAVEHLQDKKCRGVSSASGSQDTGMELDAPSELPEEVRSGNTLTLGF